MPSKDPEKRKAQYRAYYERNKARLCEKKRLRYQANLEEERAYARKRKNLYDASEEGKAKRREYRRRVAEAKGKTYRTAEERAKEKQERVGALEARRQTRQAEGPKENAWVKRLREELPELYDAAQAAPTLVFRARYHLDSAFKARQIERASKADSRNELLDDGSLTPEVMRFLFSRKECPYCGKQMAAQDKTLDHIIPRWRGGWHSASNAIVCCKSCNSRKRTRMPDEWVECVDESRRGVVRKAWSRAGFAGAEQGWLVAAN